MGFSIYVADDPDLADESGESVESKAPYYWCNGQTMEFLREEMVAQGMVSLISDFERSRLMPLVVLQWNNGWPVRPSQIRCSLAKARPRSLRAANAEARKSWREWLRFLRSSLRHGGIIVY
jgi:hypothetical protein